jgi:hypothetical protein
MATKASWNITSKEIKEKKAAIVLTRPFLLNVLLVTYFMD